MLVRMARVCLVLGMNVVGFTAMAADQTAPRVPGFDRFYAVPASQSADADEDVVVLDPVTGGRILLGDLNCTSCHQASAEAKSRLSPKQAPILDDVGSRVKTDWLRKFLASPHQLKPGTTMPDVISALPEAQRDSSVEALTHFLASTGTISEARPDGDAATRGAVLFRRVGCLACHNSNADGAPDHPTSVVLPDVGKKYTASSLMAFLKDPLKVRPSGRMPAFALNDDEVRYLAHHFVRDGLTSPNVKYSLYTGNWSGLPKFSELTPVMSGVVSGFSLGVADRSNDYAVQFSTYLKIDKAGEYRFWLGSDDGSRLTIDEQVIVDCDGVHPHETKQGRASLTVGFHRVVVEFFQQGGGASLEAEFSGQGITRQPIAGFAYLDPVVPAAVSRPDSPVFTLNQELVVKGRALFATLGCASCHQMKVDGQAIVSTLAAKPLGELVSGAGCLAENVSGRAPRFGLTIAQRQSLGAALRATANETLAETVHRTLATLNCYACHQRGTLGGVEVVRNESFESLQKEMGDEGRLPPALTGVGDKLQRDWLKHVLNQSSDDRKQYLATRMPKFGPANVEQLVSQFEAVDKVDDRLPNAEFTEPEYRVKSAGRHLVGGQALSCIKCHDFGSHASTGVRAMSLTTMNQRLRPEWFYRYVLDPQVYRRGTRMPAPWPFGQTTIRDVLNGDVNQQVQAVWLYLSDRNKASVPAGLIRQQIELKPESEPIIYRNFIEGAGARAIGVGYPEGVNLAFDANQMRLAMIWHGAFMDASRHWTGRGQGFEPPLGDDVVPLPNQVPFFVLDKPDREVPTISAKEAGYQFLGYRLDENLRPIFRYSLSGLTISDQPIPLVGPDRKVGLKRILRFEGAGETSALWYRAAVGSQIEKSGDDRYLIDRVWTMELQVRGADQPLIRFLQGKQELLVPIRMVNGQAEVIQQFHW
ncbi:PA14 domain-containing protein [Schlesneria paludicola]|uniref:PA14 domain-containing protein n=1 Tax=Schlesneria paludicola TaxID=360056 RepID=UPI00029A19C0|nr:PA14 domain-containing protein [Schlesneria paludicola]